MDSAVDGCAQAPLPALIVSESILCNYSPVLLDGILLHDIHWCHDNFWDCFDAFQRDAEAVSVDDIFVYQLPK